VLAVSLDSLETLFDFSREVNAAYPMGSDRESRVATTAYRVPVRLGMAARTLFIIDRDGVLRYVNYQYRIREDYPEVFRILEEIAGRE